MKIIVNASHVLALSRFVDAKCPNESLIGIRIEPAAPLPGAYLIALDGHKIGVLYDEQAEADQEITLKIAPDLIRACKCLKKEVSRVVHVEGGRATIRYPFSDSPLYILPGDATVPGLYPDWRALFRLSPSDRPMSDEGVCLRDLPAFDLDGGGTKARFFPTVKQGPVYVRVPTWPNFIGITMPMVAYNDPDDDASLTAKPSWLPGVK